MKFFKLVILFTLIYSSAYGQYQIGVIPRASPDKGVYEKIGYTEIEIRYGSPQVKNRDIWGSLVPYDQVWRAGANNATTIEVSQDIFIEGKKLAKGKYAFFIIPNKNKKWTAIFSNKSKQWGAFGYTEKDDALKVEVLPKRAVFSEELKYSIEHYGFEHGRIILNWEYIQLEIEIDTDYAKLFESGIISRAENTDEAAQWVAYLQGADYLVQTNTNLELAEEWIKKSEELKKVKGEWNKQYYPKEYLEGHLLWVKANLYAKKGDYNKALEYSNEMKNLGDKKLFYERKKEGERIDELEEEWRHEGEENK